MIVEVSDIEYERTKQRHWKSTLRILNVALCHFPKDDIDTYVNEYQR